MTFANARAGFWIALLVSPAMAHSATHAVLGAFTRLANVEQGQRAAEARAADLQRRVERDIDHLRAELRACLCRQ